MAYPGGNGWPEQPQQPHQQGGPGQYPQEGYQQQYPQQPQQYQGFQQYPQDQGFQQFPQQSYQGFAPEPPKKGKKGLWIGLGALGVVIAVGATLFFVLGDGDDPQPQAAPPQSSAPQSSAPRSSEPKPPSTPDNSAPADNKVSSITPGWQGIRSAKDKTAYDLPATGWETKPGDIVGYNQGQFKMVIHEASTYKLDACPGASGSNRGVVGFATADQIPVDNAARGAVRLWIQAATGKADVPLPEVKQVPIAGGAIQAISSTGTFTPPDGEECRAPSVKVTSAAFKVGEQTICFVMVFDQGTPDALPEADAQKILASLRPLQ